jgi:LAO/AO transport system kinase
MQHGLPSAAEVAAGIRSGSRVALGRAITLVESARPEHQERAREVLGLLLAEPASAEPALRIGITGSPGVGKSTFIDALGSHYVAQGERVAVLAIDPTSARTRGSILGDKTRMERLANAERAFIRPSAAGDSLGGVARKTRETILLVEAAGYSTVLVETVGVGQSETAVHGMTDLFVLLLLPGAGDELQGIKRGIVEMADLLVVNKADGDRVALANQARAHYRQAVHLLSAKPSGWTPRVLTCSSATGDGLSAVAEAIAAFRDHVRANGFFEKNRRDQRRQWLKYALDDCLKLLLLNHVSVAGVVV